MTSQSRLKLSHQLDPPDVPVVELVSTTRRNEARSVMALVAALRDHEIPIRDIVVAVRDLDVYEEPLFRAAIQYGITPVFWTQLRVTRTRPFALIESVCTALAGDELAQEQLCRPLEHRWAPRDEKSDQWPIEPNTLHQAKHVTPEDPRSPTEWIETLKSADVDSRIITFAEWLVDIPSPHPAIITSVLGDVVDAYADHGLHKTKENDSPASLNTETEARAVVRVRTLVEQLRYKFADRLEGGTLDRSWSDVAELARVIATQRPGRREHSKARALDILEANDVWMLDVSYVIAVGLTAEEWPAETDSALPPEFQEAVLIGSDDVGTLAPRTAWTDGRDRDQFADVLRAANRGIVVTRYTQTVEADEVHPSPFLNWLDVRPVSDTERQRLVATDRALPTAIRRMLADDP